MQIAQRSTSVASITTQGYYTLDRFQLFPSSLGTWTMSQSTDVPSGSGFKYSLKMTATVGDATIGAAQYCNLQHRVEGYNFADTGFGASGASSVTLSFWVKATVAGNYSVALYNSAENRIYPQQFSVLVSNTWEQKTLTIAGDTSGTWLTTNGIGVNVTFFPALGSNFLGSTGWNAGGTFGVTGQSNAIASNANIFAITGVQLEKGSTATGFDYRPYGTELALCKRYYDKTFAINTAPAQNAGRAGALESLAVRTSGGALSTYFRFSVPMRTTPTTVTFYNPSAANGQARNLDRAADCTGTSTDNINEIGGKILYQLPVGTVLTDLISVNFSADAEL